MNWQRIRQLITPTLNQLIGFPLLSLVVLVVIYFDSFYQKYVNHSPIGQNLLNEDYTQHLAALTDNGVGHTVIIVLFWSLIGFLAYTMVWSIINVVIEARNEIVVETAYTNKGSNLGRVRAIVWQVALACVLIALMLLSAAILFPIWIKLYGSFFIEPLSLIVVGKMLASVFGAALNAYIIWTLGQVVFNLA